MTRSATIMRLAGAAVIYLGAVAALAAWGWGPDPIIVGGAVALAGVVGAVLVTALGATR